MRILIGMSGGVDSTVTAALLKAQGHDVTGITLLLWGGEKNDRSCSTSDSSTAAAAAAQIGVPHIVVDLTDRFGKEVVDVFAEAAAAGVTENPCIACNQNFKFDFLFDFAKENQFDKVATGHYASVENVNGEFFLSRGKEALKDQSYFLYPALQQHLSMLLLPLGGFSKAEVRDLAASFGLSAATAPDSMNLCFSRAKVLDAKGISTIVPACSDGGAVLGTLDGSRVTIGQRFKTGGLDERLYVTGISQTAVTIGPNPNLQVTSVACNEFRGASQPLLGKIYQAQFSAHGIVVYGSLEHSEEGFVFRSSTPFRRPSPGQHIVLYDGTLLVAGSKIK